MAEQDKPGSAPAEQKTPAPPDSLALPPVAEIAGILAGIGFVTGWLYLASYYSAFGLNPLDLDYSVAMISAFAYVLLIFVLAALLAATLFILFQKLRRKHNGSRSKVVPTPPAVRTILAGLALLMGVTGWILGYNKAAKDLGCFSGLPAVAFLIDPKNGPKIEDAAADCVVNNNLSCRLLLHSKGIYYFFEQLCDQASQTSVSRGIGATTIFQLPDSQVKMVRVSRSYGQ